MATPEATHRVATLAQLVAHSLYDVWPQVEEDEILRALLIEVATVFRYLVAGDPPRAVEHLDYVDDLYLTIPNGIDGTVEDR